METKPAATTSHMNKVLIVVLLAQFIIVIDSTFMNVSISTLVADFHTSVTAIQNAITLYTLVMAALMIPGAKFGDIIGRKRAFTLGLIIYAIGTTLTSLSPTLTVFMIGWSFLEGIGAAIMLPAMMSLIVSNFPEGPARSRAYSAFAAIAGIAAGIGPIIGGFFTTFLSWRLAFFSELLIAIYIFIQKGIIIDAPYAGKQPKFDWPGFVLVGLGLATVVEGIVLASAYGLFTTRKDVTVSGSVILQAGQVSPTVILVLLGLAILAVFYWVESRRTRHRQDTLLDITLLGRRIVATGAGVQLIQNLVITGVIFSISLYLQMELGYSAILSGVTLLPLSLSVLLSAALSNRIFSQRYAPKHVIITGFIIVVSGALAMGLLASNATVGLDFALGLALVGLGIGIVASQNQNLVMSSVPSEASNETSGIINTSLNLGSSLGTSLAGAFILSVFVSTATGLVASSTTFNSSQKTQLDTAIVSKAQIVSNAQLESATASLPATEQQAVLDINSQARQQALTYVYFGLGLLGTLGIVAGARLPLTRPLAATGTKPVKNLTERNQA